MIIEVFVVGCEILIAELSILVEDRSGFPGIVPAMRADVLTDDVPSGRYIVHFFENDNLLWFVQATEAESFQENLFLFGLAVSIVEFVFGRMAVSVHDFAGGFDALGFEHVDGSCFHHVFVLTR